MIVKSKWYCAIILVCILSTLSVISCLSVDSSSSWPTTTEAKDLQFREVLEVIEPEDPAYWHTPITEVEPWDEEAYQALEDKKIVLEYEIEPGEVLKVRMGPTRLTGDAIANADAVADETGGYKIVFALAPEAIPYFADLTEELLGKERKSS